MKLPWHIVEPLPARQFAEIRRAAIFECCKWDPQIEDVGALSPQALVLTAEAWKELTQLSEQLAREMASAEREILDEPALLRELGLPWSLRRRLADADVRNSLYPQHSESPRHLRLVRFDFHHTTGGWRISEANCDVPGGFNEASGFSRLMAPYFSRLSLPGDPTRAMACAIRGVAGELGNVALVHATAFTDDRQVMVYLSRELKAMGMNPLLIAPDHLRWDADQPAVSSDWFQGPVQFVFRFFPAEWLPELSRRCRWWHLLGNSRVGLCNPGSSIVTQSKRFPLIWDRLETDLTCWRMLLPATSDPRHAGHQLRDKRLVYKTALGRVGDLIGMEGVTPAKEARLIHRQVRRYPENWIAQERFEAVPYRGTNGDVFPCIGVYTLNGRVIGAYGRIARTPLINHLAQDAAVFIADAIPADHHEPLNDLQRTLQNVGA